MPTKSEPGTGIHGTLAPPGNAFNSSPNKNTNSIIYTFAGAAAKIVRMERRVGERVYHFYYLVAPVELNPNLNVGDHVKMLIQVGGPFGGFTAWIPGRVMGRYKNFQIYIGRTGRSLAEYIYSNGLVPIVFDIQKADKTKS